MSNELGGGSAPLIHLSCFGGLQVTAETPLGPAFLQPRVVALLAIVAAAGTEGVGEARLLELLWSDTESAQAQAALTAALTALRRSGNGDALITAIDPMTLNSDRVDSDVSRFLAACDRGDAPAALEAYSGPFLEGVDIGAGPVFDAWMVEARARFARQHTEAIRSVERAGEIESSHAGPVEDAAPRRGRWWAIAALLVIAALSAFYLLKRPRGPNRQVAAAVAQASSLWREGEVANALAMLDSLVTAHPDEGIAWQLLGEVRFRSGPIVGASVVTSRAAFERAVALDPQFDVGWQRLLRGALVARDTAGAERAWRGMRAAMGPAADTAYGWLRSSWTADSLPLQEEVQRASAMPAAVLLERALLLGFEAGRTPEALALTEPLLGEGVAFPDRMRALALRAALHGAVGDWRQADADAAMMSRDWPWGGLMVAVAAALAPTRNESASKLRALRDRVMRAPLDTTTVTGAELPPASRTLRLYLVGELSARLNDGRGVQAAIDSLASPKLGELTLPRRGGSYALTLQAIQLAARGDTAEALARLELAASAVPLADQRTLWVAGMLERRRRAHFLATLGRDEEAAGWAASTGQFPADLLLGPPPR